MNKTAQNPPPSATIAPRRPARFRWQAFAIHLGISLTILAVLLYLLFYYWFPDYLFDTDGGWQALQIIIGVDVILGPLLTLVAANPKKPFAELRRDLCLVAIFQIVALSGGVWVAYDSRPVALIYLDGWLLPQAHSVLSEYPDVLQRIEDMPGRSPKKIFVQLPDYENRTRLYAEAMQNGRSALYTAHLYRPLAEHVRDIRALNRPKLFEPLQTPIMQQRLKSFAETHGVAIEDTLWLPTKSRYRTYYVALDARTGQVMGALLDASPRYVP